MESPFTLPPRVSLGEITVREGLQGLEHYFPARQKVRLAEELVQCGFRHLEVTNFGNPKAMPQFKDAEEVLDRLFDSEVAGPRLKQNGGEVTLCAVTINQRAADRALDYKARKGRGPDYILQMVSTDPAHHRTNSGSTLEDYWKMTERCIAMARAAGIGVCGTVSTIWGSPMRGSQQTRLETAVEFARRYLEIGAAYIEHADHDGSADPARVFEYFRMVLDPSRLGRHADPALHLAHFHTTRGMGLANYLAALQAGVSRFETTLSGLGGQPANAVDGVPVGGTGAYYHANHLLSGLVGTEDFAVMLESMGVATGLDLPRLLALGRRFRDGYLRIGKDDLAALLANLSRATGLDLAQLERLREGAERVEALAHAAAPRLAEGGRPIEEAHKVARELLGSAAHYLRHEAWAPSRAETLDAGLPPSPKLARFTGP